MTGLYFGSLVCVDLGQELQSEKQYGEGYMGLLLNSFKCGRWSWRKRFLTANSKNFLVVSCKAPLYAILCTTDPRYLEGDRERRKRGGTRAKKPNVHFRSSSTAPRGEFRMHELLKMNAVMNIKADKELLVDYFGKFIS